jgi:hypothetical protein
MTIPCSSTKVPSASIPKRHSAITAARVVAVWHDLARIEDVVTISAIARRTRVSRPTVRRIPRDECGWSPAHSQRAHHAGVSRGKLLQAVTGHAGLAQGRETLQARGWPNLQRARATMRASSYPALQRGRETQAARGWHGLLTTYDESTERRSAYLARGRSNLAARGWPNLQQAQEALKAQEYLPLLDALRLRNSEVSTQQNVLATDRRRARGRTTRLAILEAVETYRHNQLDRLDPRQSQMEAETLTPRPRTMAKCIAAQLHLHPATVYAHLQRLSTSGIIP